MEPRMGSTVRITAGKHASRVGTVKMVDTRGPRPVYGVVLQRTGKALRCDRTAFEVVR